MGFLSSKYSITATPVIFENYLFIFSINFKYFAKEIKKISVVSKLVALITL